MTKNFRRTQLEALRSMNNWLRTMTHAWGSPPSTIWYDSGDGKGVRWHLPSDRRARKDIPAHEYPESNPEELQRLIKYMTAVASMADQISAAAQAQLKLIDYLDDQSA
jgi:hypothetical protein